MPLAELQSKWVSRYLLGKYALPSPEEMMQDIQREREEMGKRYGNSPRHTMQVDVEPYVVGVLKEMERGAKRPQRVPLIKQEAPGARDASLSPELTPHLAHRNQRHHQN